MMGDKGLLTPDLSNYIRDLEFSCTLWNSTIPHMEIGAGIPGAYFLKYLYIGISRITTKHTFSTK